MTHIAGKNTLYYITPYWVHLLYCVLLYFITRLDITFSVSSFVYGMAITYLMEECISLITGASSSALSTAIR